MKKIDQSRNFIYPDGVYPQKKKLFDDWKRGSNGKSYEHWNCFSPERFEKYLLFKEKLPYDPENKYDDILKTFVDCSDANSFDLRLRYWNESAERYRLRGNIQESNEILSSLKRLFNDWIDGLTDPDEKEYMSEEWSFLDKF